MQILKAESFEQLALSLERMNEEFQRSAVSAINKHVTCRNWLNGFYIYHYEQNGSDRAKYGQKLLQNLSKKLHIKGYSYSDLKLYRQFFLQYRHLLPAIADYMLVTPGIGQSLIGQLGEGEIGQSLISQFSDRDLQPFQKRESEGEIPLVPPEKLFNSLSYTHFIQLLPIEDPLERAFYEIECINGTWSTRELKRQIDSGYFIRSGLSKNKDSLRDRANLQADHNVARHAIKSPFVLEFLGLKNCQTVEESNLEAALIDHLQEFMLEMGNGFCFEARQKRILVDDEYFYMDLVFYNRIARFGVVVELKSHKLTYQDVAQLNMYLTYYRKNMMHEGDSPPVGILLCTAAGKEMVEYATTGIDDHLFVTKYLLELPSKEELVRWLYKELEQLR